jgi:hypothetical protein
MDKRETETSSQTRKERKNNRITEHVRGELQPVVRGITPCFEVRKVVGVGDLLVMHAHK